MRQVKAVRLGYESSEELSSLFEEFRLMCNDAVRIALKEKPKNRFRLIELAYPTLKEYGLHTHYVLSACEVAFSAVKNRKRKSDPYITKHFIKLDNQSYVLNHLILRIPTRARRFVYLTLRASNYQLSFLEDPSLTRGSIALTDSALVIAFSRESAEIDTKGRLGIDVNERNATWSDSSGMTVKEDISQVAELKERYKAIRSKIAQRTNKDRRIMQGLLATYGKREKDRTAHAIHRITRRIVNHANANGQAIIMEKLKGIRKLYRRGNGQGKDELVDLPRTPEAGRV